MFHKQTHPNETSLRMQIDRLFEKLDNLDPRTDEYAAVAAQAEKLYKLREVDSNVNSKKRENNAAWAAIAANLATVAMIVGHEKAHVITSFAKSFVQKLH